MILNHKANDCDAVDINFLGGGGVKGMGHTPQQILKKEK